MLKDKKLQNALDKLGFSKFDIGDKAFIQSLRELYTALYEQEGVSKDMTVTHNGTNYENSIAVHEKIVDLVSPQLADKIEGFDIYLSHFVIKKAHSETAFQLHQDWNIVDETKYKSYQIWIPLEPSYPENGGLCFVPESNQFLSNIRSGSFGITDIPIEEALYPYLSYIRTFVGEAIVFENRTLHGSFMNSTDKDRVAVIVNVVQKEAQPLYFEKLNDNELAAYDAEITTFLKHLHLLEKGQCPFESAPVYQKAYHQEDNASINAQFLIDTIQARNTSLGRAKDYEHKMFPLLKDDSLEKLINHQGYAVLDFMDEESIVKLKEVFNDAFPDRSLYEGIYSSMQYLEHDVRKKYHDEIMEIMDHRIKEFFDDYTSPISLLYSRRPDGKYLLEWHGDPSIMLNQHLEPLYGIWFPLNDVDATYGALKLVPGSHRIMHKLIFTYNTFQWPLLDKRALLDKYGKSFKLKAGQALVYDARMVHSSEPNNSTIERDNIMFRLNNTSSKYFKIVTQSITENHVADLYEQDKDFFFSKAVKEHTLTPDTGSFSGKVSLFYQDISEEAVANYLDRFKEATK